LHTHSRKDDGGGGLSGDETTAHTFGDQSAVRVQTIEQRQVEVTVHTDDRTQVALIREEPLFSHLNCDESAGVTTARDLDRNVDPGLRRRLHYERSCDRLRVRFRKARAVLRQRELHR